jgi:hypothetical protein
VPEIVIFLTSGTNFVVPADWNDANNKIELWGAGANASGASGGRGGGGGAFAAENNYPLTPGANITYQIGAVSTLASANRTFFNSTAIVAAGSANHLGGTTTNSTGTIKFAGGNGVLGANGAGGGAAGPNGAGGNAVTTTGGTGDNGSGGAGGVTAGQNGSPGAERTQTSDSATAGSGGGGAGGSGNPGGSGGLYGSGGAHGTSIGSGRAGLIVISYTPASSDTTGTLAVTEGADTFASAGASWSGALAATESADTFAALGALSFSGAFAATEASDAGAAAATLTFHGDMAATEAGDVVAAAGTVFGGQLAAVETADGFAANALLFTQGNFSASEFDDIAQFAGILDFRGALNVIEPDAPDTVSGAGHVYIGSLAVSEASDVAAMRLLTYRRYDDLLPQNATPLLRTFAMAMGRIQDIPVPIDTAKQPLIVTASFLPFVAWEYSVDVWFTKWPEATKRAIAQRSIQLHQRKGTLYAISEYIRYAGGVVLGVTRPPMTVFSGPSLTRAQRQAWLATLPQVRVWLIREEARFGPAKAFHGCQRGGLFVERSYAVPSTALSRLRRRARWVVDGVETDVPVKTFDSYYRLHLRSTEGRSVFVSRPFGRRFFIPSSAWRRLVTIRPQARLPWRSPSGPTLTPVSNEPERIKVAGNRGRSVFENMTIGGYFVPSSAKYRIFDRFAVHDGSRPLRNPACQFMGTGRYGFPMHTAWLRLSVPGKASPRAAGRGFFTPRTKFWLPHDGEPLQRVRRAAQSAKRLSDRVLLDIGPKPRLIAGRPFIAGTDRFVVGRP